VIDLNSRRQGLDIEAEILRICKDGAKKTWIVYRANLNFAIVKGYIEELKGQGLLSENDDLYQSTEQGLEFLGEYAALRKIRYPETTKITTEPDRSIEEPENK